MSPDLLSVIVRAGEFIALLQAAGGTLYVAVFGERLERTAAAARRLAFVAALTAMPLVVAHLLLDAARMAGGYDGMHDAGLLRLALYSGSGAAHAIQLAGLALMAQGLRRAGAPAPPALVGAACVVAAFALTGHTSVHALRWLLAPLLALHVGLVAFWFGSLAPLLYACAREPAAIAAEVLRRFSTLAGRLVPLIPAAGLAIAFVLVPDLAALLQPYGLLLGAKLLGFGLLMVLAALNRWRWAPALAAGTMSAPATTPAAGAVPAADAASARAALRRSLAAEYLLVVAVLAATAALTSLYSPDQ